jgi:hypothetical protein
MATMNDAHGRATDTGSTIASTSTRRGGRLRRLVSGFAAAAAMVVVAGCGSVSPPAGPALAAPTTAGEVSSPPPNVAVDPNAPEVNAAGDIPDNQVFVPFTPAGSALTVSIPQGWARSVEGPSTVFTDKFNHVGIEVQPLPAAPDVASVKATEVPRLQQSTPGFVLTDVTQVQRKGGPAVLVRFLATSATNPVTGRSVTEAVERYTFWKAGQEAVLTLAGPKGADNVDPWRTVSDSLRWQR